MLSLILALVLGQIAPTEAHTGKSGLTVFVQAPKTGAVTTAPILTVNGQGVPLNPGPIGTAFWSFTMAPMTTIASDGTMTSTPRPPLNRGDQLGITAPAGWVAGAPAMAMPVRNSVGRVEFDLPKPVMGIGFNTPAQPSNDNGPYSLSANWARRLRKWDATVTATDPAGYPTQFAAGRTRADGYFCHTVWPGRWTMVYDALDPATNLLFGWYSGPTTPALRPELSCPGVGGIGITKVYDVPPGGAVLAIMHPQGKPSFTNLQLLPPGNSPSTDPLALEASVVKALSVGGGRGPACLRFMDSCSGYGGASNAVQPSDLAQDPTRLSYAQGLKLPTVVALATVRPWVSGTVTTVHGAIPFPAGMNVWGGPGLQVEVTTAAPHGLDTTCRARVDFKGAVVSVGGVARTLQYFDTLILVTGPTSFFCSAGSAKTLATVDAEVALSGATVSVDRTYGQHLPLEFAAAAAGRFGGCDLWRNIPAAASDDLIAEMARRDLAALPSGHRVILEYSNETWDYGTAFSQSWYCFALGTLTKTSGIGGYTVRRSLDCAAIYRKAFTAAGRGSDVVACLAGQLGQMGALAGLAVDEYRASGRAFDAMACAPYCDCSFTDDNFLTYPSAGKLDVWRHWIMLDSHWLSYLDEFAAAVKRYETAIGRRIGRYGYEGGLDHLRTYSPYEWAYDPDAYDTERCLHASLQSRGFDALCYFTLLSKLYQGSCWGVYAVQGELAGTGDGTDGRAVNNIAIRQATPGTVSPRGLAVQDWQRESWMGGVPAGRPPWPAPPPSKN